MFLNQFSVRVVGGNEVAGGYVEMSHGQQYSLSLRNDRLVRCDARVEIDGKAVGTWRIAANSSVTLERPAHDTGHFTFYKAGTPEARQAALNESSQELGLIRVVFTPEQAPRPLTADAGVIYGAAATSSYTSTRSLSAGITKSSRSAGGTGLSGKSGQQFYQADEIEYDLTQQTVIHLRLVCKDDGEQPRPLTEYSTPIPPPVR